VRELPAGTVTFLFTDIEGSTRLLHDLGAEAYAHALAEHRRVLRAAFAAHDGVEVDTQGDAFFVAFPTAPGALAAAAQAQAALALPVRMGVHTGTPLLAEEGYVGPDVNRAARIAAAGHGGQVLVSAATASLAEGVKLRDLGEHRFKDLAAPERVYQLGEAEFEPLRSLYRANVPVPATPFLGRERDLAAVAERLRDREVKLLTLTGPGGTGKTRLALQAAAEVAEEFPDGITWIALAPLADPALVLPTIAHGLGVQQDGERPLDDLLAGSLEGRRMLVILDNAEHLLPRVAEDVARLRDIGGPTLLVTSRERLQLQGEHVVGVPSLTRPDAVALFVARTAGLGVSLTRDQVLDTLCERLDDLPLAIELAAARTLLFTPEQLLARLGQRLDLLRGGRDADPRQQTLRATIQWSHDLLDDAERTLFRRLSVFAGGCDYEAVEALCEGEAEVLQSLLDKSLVRRREDPTGLRYWMLETIREFAAERLAETAEADALKRRHAAHYAARVAEHAVRIRNHDIAAEAFVAAETPNLRAGLAVALSNRDAPVVARYLYGLWFHWLATGFGREGAAAARAWLELEAPADPSDHFAGLLGAGEILRATGAPTVAIELKRVALAIARADPSRPIFAQPVARWISALLSDLAHLLVDAGREDEARPLAEEALALRRELGHPSGIAHALIPLMEIEDQGGNLDGAYRLACEALLHYEEGGLDYQETYSLRAARAEYELLLGRPQAAAATLASLLEARAISDVTDLAMILRVAAALADSLGELERAARLRGAFERVGDETGVLVASGVRFERDAATVAHTEAQLGVEAFRRARQAGGEAAIDVVLEELACWLAELRGRPLHAAEPATPTVD
jgi:predicted ATPase